MFANSTQEDRNGRVMSEEQTSARKDDLPQIENQRALGTTGDFIAVVMNGSKVAIERY